MPCQRINLLSPEPLDFSQYPEAQVQLYNFLLQRFSEVKRISLREMMDAMNCTRPEPIKKRLEHLQERGLIQLRC